MSSIIRLNVGGTKYCTTLSTLMAVEGSMLARMFSNIASKNADNADDELEAFGLEKDPQDGSYFIDRDGPSFRFVMSYLRDVEQQQLSSDLTAIIIPDDKQEISMLRKEADFYLLPKLVEACDASTASTVSGTFKEYDVVFFDRSSDPSSMSADLVTAKLREGWSLVGGFGAIPIPHNPPFIYQTIAR